MPHAVPYWRLSLFYFAYFGTLGALVPYWSVYLDARGFGPREIGELMALLMATRIVAPYVWGTLADRTGMRMAVVRLAAVCAALSFAGVFLGSGFLWLALVMAVFSFFWNAALPQFEATTLNYLGDAPQHYSRVRLWGSIGFIVAVVGLGYALRAHGPLLLPQVLLGLFALIALAAWLVPDSGLPAAEGGHLRLRDVLRRPEVVALIVTCFLMQASHGPYYTFYTLYLEGHGYARDVVGLLWALGVVAEIGIFLAAHRLLPWLGERRLILISIAAAVIRWAVIGAVPEEPAWITLVQLLHALTFGTFHAAAIHMVHRLFRGPNQGRGQALYASVSFGLGGAAGAYAGGHLWAGWGGSAAFIGAAVVAGIAWLVAYRGLRPAAA